MVAFKPILDKKQHFKHMKGGLYGNRLRVWTIHEYEKADFEGLVVLRYLVGGSKSCRYDLTRQQAYQSIQDFIKEGADPGKITVNEQASHDALVIQGEYSTCPEDRGVFLYSTALLPMRQALSLDTGTFSGLASKLVIDHSMSPSSAADFWALVDLFPHHVIEFSVFRRPLGDLPGRNAIVWEVRRY